MQTPSSDRRYGRFRNKQNETSSYYKWRPEVEEEKVRQEQTPAHNVETTRSMAEKRPASRKAESEKPPVAHIRIKPKAIKVPTSVNPEPILIQDDKDML